MAQDLGGIHHLTAITAQAAANRRFYTGTLGMRLVKNRGHKRAVTALARRMAVLMHRIWVEGTTFIWKTGDGQAIAQRPIPAV